MVIVGVGHPGGGGARGGNDGGAHGYNSQLSAIQMAPCGPTRLAARRFAPSPSRAASVLAVAALAAAGCADGRDLHAGGALVRRLQARHQPGQLPVAGHGRQAEGRARPARRCGRCSARRSSLSAFRDNRWDYVYEFTRQGSVRRAPQRSPSTSSTTSSRAGKATRCRRRWRSSTASARDKSLAHEPVGRATRAFLGWLLGDLSGD